MKIIRMLAFACWAHCSRRRARRGRRWRAKPVDWANVSLESIERGNPAHRRLCRQGRAAGQHGVALPWLHQPV